MPTKNRFHIDRFIEHVGKEFRANQLKPHQIYSWIDAKYGCRSATYKNTAISVIQGVFRWATYAGFIEQNPISSIKKPKSQTREFFLPQERWKQLIDAANCNSLRNLIIVMLHTGARPQEMRKMEARHYDQKYARVVFPILESKGRRHPRTIYLEPQSEQIVRRRCAEFVEGPIFRNTRGNPWTKDALSARFRRLSKKLEMADLCAYSLRHSYAHQMLTLGVDAHVISKLMGHADGRMLFSRYGHLEQNARYMRAAANFIHQTKSN